MQNVRGEINESEQCDVERKPLVLIRGNDKNTKLEFAFKLDT